MSTPTKDTIYVDVDDEITGIIDKLRGSSHKVVALVLPKRAATLQSIVNMKLLKRTADQEKKNLVLITSEAGLLPLAGSVGIHVAKTLQSKPEIPAPPSSVDSDADDEPLDVESEPTDFNPKDVSEKSVGELAGISPADEPSSKTPDDEIDLGDMSGLGAAEAGASKKKDKKSKKDKKLSIPDFIKFRRLLLLGGLLLVVLIIVAVILMKVLPKALITVQTTNSTVKSNLNVSLDSASKTFDPAKAVLPATVQQTTKTNSQQAPATGQKNSGTPASGTVSLSAQECAPNLGQPSPVGTGVGVSAHGQTFLTQQVTTFHIKEGKGNCVNYQADDVTPVISQSPGTAGNISSTGCSVPGRSDIVGCSTNGSFSGGTDNILKIVAQNDIDNASKQLSAQDSSAIKLQLQNALQQAGIYPIPVTFSAGSPSVSSSPSVGTQADAVTVTQTVIYTMLGIQKVDLQTLVKNAVKQQIDINKQSILNDGVDKATVTVLNQTTDKAQVTIQVQSDVGVNIDTAAIKKQAAGKKSGDIQTLIKSYPGVTDVNVHYSPFWVNVAPSNSSKITVVLKKAK